MSIDVGAIKKAADAAQETLDFAAFRNDVGAEWFSQEHFEVDNWPRSMAEHLSLCSPATLLALVAVVEAAQAFNRVDDEEMGVTTPDAMGRWMAVKTRLFSALAPFTPGAPGARDE